MKAFNLVKLRAFALRVLYFLGLFSVYVLSSISNAKEIDLKIPVKEHETIQINAEQGAFSVSGWNENFIELTGMANEDVHFESKELTLVLQLNSNQPLTAQDNLEIKVPSDKEVSITANNADFILSGLKPQLINKPDSKNNQLTRDSPNIEFSSVDGSISVVNSSGNFTINTINGDISILESRGIASIKSFSGNQNVEADLRDVTSSNVSGKSSYKLRTIEKLNLNNVNGDSVVESAISPAASVQMRSVKGNVQLLVPEETSAKFSLQSHQGGQVRNEIIEVPDVDNNPNKKNFILGDASANVSINTMSGSISILSQKAIASQYVDENYDWSAVDTSILKFAFINPKHSIFNHKEIFIKQPEIHFDPKWEVKFGKGITNSYKETTSADYASLLKKAVANKFSRDMQFEIVEERTDNSLVIIPKVLDLYIDFPDTVAIRDVVTSRPAGSAKIDLVIYSPSDKAILALVVDKRTTANPKGNDGSVINRRAFSELFNDWARDIVKVLEK